MRWFRIALFPLLLGAAAPQLASAETGGEPSTVQELVSTLEAQYKNVRTLQANVVQVTRNSMGEVRMKGRVFVERPRKARWELSGATKEQETLFVSDGTTGWLYTPASKQVFKITEQGQGASPDVLDIINNLDQHFDAKMLPDAGGKSYVIEATPKAGSKLAGQYKQLRLEVDRKEYLPDRIVLTDHFGGQTEISFSSAKFNVDIKPDLFQFTPPPGVSVVSDAGM